MRNNYRPPTQATRTCMTRRDNKYIRFYIKNSPHNLYRKGGENMNKPYYITYSAETVVYNSDGNKIVACPTEQEAIEFIDNYLTT